MLVVLLLPLSLSFDGGEVLDNTSGGGGSGGSGKDSGSVNNSGQWRRHSMVMVTGVLNGGAKVWLNLTATAMDYGEVMVRPRWLLTPVAADGNGGYQRLPAVMDSSNSHGSGG
jgi:hypothetical protein